MLTRYAAIAAGLLALTAVGSAHADEMDPALERLVTDRFCHVADDGISNFGQYRYACKPDHAAFKRLVSQYGFAFAPNAMHSARTTGFGGFHLSLEGSYTSIDNGAAYWKNGTQGPVDTSTDLASVRNSDPASVLQLYSAKIRKSFGFGLELTGQVGFMPSTSLISGGADVRLSLLEGFREGIPGILPDVAVGGGVRTITGTPQFQLTVAGLDIQISKPLPIADSSVITPWVGWQYVWIFGDSGLVDLTPGTDAVGFCNYSGPNIPGNPDPAKPGVFDGQPVCNGGSSDDFNNYVVFDNARLERQRLMFGLNYRYEMVMIGGEFITDIVDPADAQNDDDDKKALENEDRQWTVVLEVGAMF